MNEIMGWLLDIYADSEDGVVLWLLGEDGRRYRLRHAFAVTFYAAGPATRLRQLWRYLQSQPVAVNLERTRREDLFSGMCTVLAVQVPNAAAQERLFQETANRFPDLDYYDADVPLALRYGAIHGTFPLARCRARVDDDGRLKRITPLESPWELDPSLPPLRVLTIEADVDPAHASPSHLELHCGRASYHLPLDNERGLLVNLKAILTNQDPDLILTRRGDTWLFPHLFELAQRCGIPFNPNRDPQRQVLQRKE
ncbi:MAG: hypothetical protein P8Z00_15280, partial [Anaerolineales bacterium]